MTKDIEILHKRICDLLPDPLVGHFSERFIAAILDADIHEFRLKLALYLMNSREVTPELYQPLNSKYSSALSMALVNWASGKPYKMKLKAAYALPRESSFIKNLRYAVCGVMDPSGFDNRSMAMAASFIARDALNFEERIWILSERMIDLAKEARPKSAQDARERQRNESAVKSGV